MTDNLRTFLTKLRELVKEHNVVISTDSCDGSLWVDDKSVQEQNCGPIAARFNDDRSFVNALQGDLSVETLDELLKQ